MAVKLLTSEKYSFCYIFLWDPLSVRTLWGSRSWRTSSRSSTVVNDREEGAGGISDFCWALECGAGAEQWQIPWTGCLQGVFECAWTRSVSCSSGVLLTKVFYLELQKSGAYFNSQKKRSWTLEELASCFITVYWL